MTGAGQEIEATPGLKSCEVRAVGGLRTLAALSSCRSWDCSWSRNAPPPALLGYKERVRQQAWRTAVTGASGVEVGPLELDKAHSATVAIQCAEEDAALRQLR